MIERVISQLNQSQAEELKAIVEKMYQEGEKGNAFPNIDRQFHVVLLSNVGNSTLIQILDIFWLTFRKASNTLNLENTSPLATAKHHDEILQACLDSDPERVKQALIEHYRDIEERLNNLNWNTSNVE